ncbi:MAG: cupin domain-containing protein [Chloroflexi bacterium]|nr:cupin domain-containing protein [Chloroflexota bacterium]
MPIIRKGQVPSGDLGGNISQALANVNLGAARLTVNHITMVPGGEIRLHTHPGHEECMVILSGALTAVMAGKEETVSAGDTIIAPSDVIHGLKNTSGQPATFIAIFPTTDVQRQWIEG